MAYDEALAQRVREALSHFPDLVEKKMFGGVGHMLLGNMACGVRNDELIVRVGPERYEEALGKPNAREFDYTGRPMKGWVVISSTGLESDADLEDWVQQGAEFALTLPAK